MKQRQPVLVALDGSANSERAVWFAAEQARASQAVLQLVHVHELTSSLHRDPSADTACGLLARVETQTRLGVLADQLAMAGVRALPVLLEGTAEPALLRYIARVQPVFVIMAPRGPAGVLRSRPGSVTEMVLRASAAPVILLPLESTATKTRSVRRVLVALDGSPLSEHVLPTILEFAPRIEMVYLMRVLSTSDDSRSVQAYLDAIVERFGAHEQPACTLVAERGRPADLIVEKSLAHAVDLIALTTHSRRDRSPPALGSCTDAVLRRSRLPVLTVNPAQALTNGRLAEIESLTCA